MEAYVKRLDIGKLAVIEFFTPKSNSLPANILQDLATQISRAGDDDSVQLILLRSHGDSSFCAGASFDELALIENKIQGLEFFSGFAKVILAIKSCGKIVIGRIHGKAVGGGVGIAAACDYTIATKYATIKLSELAVGIGPFVIGPVVERKMGLAAFSQLALNATEWQTAYWAKEKSLYQEVFDTSVQMDEYIDHFSQKLLNSNPDALFHLKKIFWEGTDHWSELLLTRASISGELVLSDFSKKAVSKIS